LSSIHRFVDSARRILPRFESLGEETGLSVVFSQSGRGIGNPTSLDVVLYSSSARLR
jgi:hypothetical protein